MPQLSQVRLFNKIIARNILILKNTNQADFLNSLPRVNVEESRR